MPQSGGDMKLAVIFNDQKLSGKLTKFFTGCYAYHCAWVDETEGHMYDMHLIRRRRPWPHYSAGQVLLFDFSEVTREYLEYQLTHDESWYGVGDYLLFGLRGLYHLFGKSTVNAGGVICSEQINYDLRNSRVDTPWKVTDEPPSPCDIYRWAVSRTVETPSA